VTVWLRGDHLVRAAGPVADRPDDRVLMIEATEFARKLPYHPHKLTLVFSAMRHFRDRLRQCGRAVDYRQVDSFTDGLAAHFEAHPGDTLVTPRPQAEGAADRLDAIVGDHGGTVEFVPDARFLCSPDSFDEWAGDTDRYRHEDFYRYMRRETGYLIADGDPVGGEWNYDDRNRETPPDDWDPPEIPTFEPDETTREVETWVRETFDGGYAEPPYGGEWADPEPFRWPVTRRGAVRALDHFVTHRLTEFGPYQDAMRREEWAMSHSLLSTSLNLGLLRPAEVVERAIDAYRDGDAPLHSVEGFVRQVIGWREFLRHVYRRETGLAEANQLDADRDLPEAYWTGETEMACLSDVVDGVRERGYSHHIERLMILANFGLIYGVEPAQLNRWFHAGYVDAFHWVTTPNVVEMGLYGAGVFATKPYAASANYVDKMSDYCSDCPYYKTKTTGEGACPFNALYWDFLDRNGDRLRSNHRMGLMYSHVDDKDEAEWDAIRERADEIREMAREGEL